LHKVAAINIYFFERQWKINQKVSLWKIEIHERMAVDVDNAIIGFNATVPVDQTKRLDVVH